MSALLPLSDPSSPPRGALQTSELLANTSTIAAGGAGALLLPLMRHFPPEWLPTVDANDEVYKPGVWKPLSARAKMGQARNGPLRLARAMRVVTRAALQVAGEYEDALQNGGTHVSSSSLSELHDGFTRPDNPITSLQRWGPVGVLCINGISAQIDVGMGGRRQSGSLLSGETWQRLESSLQEPDIGTQVIKPRCGLVCRCSSKGTYQ